MIIDQYDTNNKKSINFVEFCKFKEDLWNSSDMLKEQSCNLGFVKSQEVFRKLFEWLDRDKDSFITPEDMIYGISRIMIRDVDVKEIQGVFEEYDKEKTGKLDLQNFLLGITNGKLDLTFGNPLMTNTFIK